MTRQLAGHCHCGAIRVVMDTPHALAELPLRECTCSFCRRRCALTTSDPDGHLHIEATPGSVTRYRFGLNSCDFILCDECGTYVAALTESDIGLLGVVNVRGVAFTGFEGRTPEPMVYDDETAETRLARRKTRWMPAVLVEAQPNA
jgi:hypothetical protein